MGARYSCSPPYNRVIVPGRVGEKSLHSPGGLGDHLRKILGVAPLPGLRQQGLQIMTAALPRLPAAKQPSEIGVKLLKFLIYLLESRRIHFPASPDQAFPNLAVILTRQLSL